MGIITIKDGYRPGFLTWNCVLPTMAHKFAFLSFSTYHRYIPYERHTMQSSISGQAAAPGLLNLSALPDGCTAPCRGGSWAWEAGGGRSTSTAKLAILPKKLSGVNWCSREEEKHKSDEQWKYFCRARRPARESTHFLEVCGCVVKQPGSPDGAK